MADEIEYGIEPRLGCEEFIAVLRGSGLAERRPVDDRTRIQAMLDHAQVIATARHRGRLVGVARAITDFAYCVYLSDLAVDLAYQRRGIGRELMRRTHRAAGTQTTMILLAAPAATSYYPHVGLEKHDSCWIVRPPEATS